VNGRFQASSFRLKDRKAYNIDIAGPKTTRFVGKAIGTEVDGEAAGPDQFRTNTGIMLPCMATNTARGTSVFALRPERVAIIPGGSDGIQAHVSAVTYLGAHTEYHFDLGGLSLLAVKATPNEADPLRRLRHGDQVSLSWDRDAARILPSQAETSTGVEP